MVLSASNRPGSQSLKVSRRMVEKLQSTGVDTKLLDLSETKLPLFDSSTAKEWLDLEPQIAAADGFVWVVPEWDGMAPPAMINFLGHASKTLAHKPVLLVGISSGLNGAYPVAELKMVGGKNRHHVLVPEHLVLKNVEELFNETTPVTGNSSDKSMHERAIYALRTLVAYAQKLAELRNTPGLELGKYQHGM